MSDCTCWVEYPNKSHRHESGKWKCVDCYENVRQLETIPLEGLPFPRYVRKTKCVKKGECMNNADKESYKNLILGMKEEEKAFITRMIPSEYMIDELKRRDIVVNQSLGQVVEILQSAKEGMSLDEMQNMISDIRSVLRGA